MRIEGEVRRGKERDMVGEKFMLGKERIGGWEEKR